MSDQTKDEPARVVIVRGFVPLRYLDDTSPEPRPRPQDWLVMVDGVVRLDAFENGDAPGPILAERETVVFSKLTGFPSAALLIGASDYTVSTPMPPDANCCGVEGFSIHESLKSLVESFRKGGDASTDFFVVDYWAWTDSAYQIIGGRLIEVVAG